jgi:hypothetical protein
MLSTAMAARAKFFERCAALIEAEQVARLSELRAALPARPGREN